MQFDVIISNPPYNNNLDYEFFDLSYKLANRFISFIHPLRWKCHLDNKNSYNVRHRLIDERHMKEIHCFESGRSGVTVIWPNVQTNSVGYWLLDKNNQYDAVDTYLTMSHSNYNKEPLFERRNHYEKCFPYFCMNGIVLGIVKKVLRSNEFKSIRHRFETSGDLYIANTLFTAYLPEDRTSDCRVAGFSLDEYENLNCYLNTAFWRALTRQFKSGFHSCSIEYFDYLPDFEFVAICPTDDFIAKKFQLNDIEINYLQKYKEHKAENN